MSKFLDYKLCSIILNREMHHARQWHSMSMYQSVMIVHSDLHIHVDDFIKFNHDILGITLGKVLQFFQKVHLYLLYNYIVALYNVMYMYVCLYI